MSLSQDYGGTSFPLDPALITSQTGAARKQIRHAADPLLDTLTEYLATVLNAELQPALDVVKSEQPDTLQVTVKNAIPAAPEKFVRQITRSDLPILCVYRVGGTHADEEDAIGVDVDQAAWRAEYVMPELEAWQIGSMLGFDDAVQKCMSLALKIGQHSAYNGGASVAGSLEEPIAPGAYEFLNWNVPEISPDILFPAVRLTFVTKEKSTPNNADGSRKPLEAFGIDFGLEKQSEDQDDLSEFVQSEVTFFNILSATVDGTTLSITLSKDFDEDTLPNFAGWRLFGTESYVTGYGSHTHPVAEDDPTIIALTLDQALQAAEVGVATVRLARYGLILTAADGLGAIEEHEPVVITAPPDP